MGHTPDTKTFNPSRLGVARRCRGLTKTRLAAAIGVEARSVRAYEAGEFAPDGVNLAKIAASLKFPQAFFFGEDLDEPAADRASFRAITKMSARQRDMALGSALLALLLNQWIGGRYVLPKPDLPHSAPDGPPESAADAVRHAWGLGELPIKNMIQLLERRGVRVYSLPEKNTGVDTFSLWHADVPFVFLNIRKQAEAVPFDAAHELGHLVMHRHVPPHGPKAEQEADSFASAFLMPSAQAHAQASRCTSVDQLNSLAEMWGQSSDAIASRLHRLGLLSDWAYRKLYIEIATRDYRKSEGDEGSYEISQVLKKVFVPLHRDGVTRRNLADTLHLNSKDVDELVFGLALAPIDDSTAETQKPTRLRPHLTFVKSGD